MHPAKSKDTILAVTVMQSKKRLRCLTRHVRGEPASSMLPLAMPAGAEANEQQHHPDTSIVDLAFWEREGYAIVKGAAAASDCAAMVDEIWKMAGKRADDRSTWHKRMPAGATRSATRSPAQVCPPLTIAVMFASFSRSDIRR